MSKLIKIDNNYASISPQVEEESIPQVVGQIVIHPQVVDELKHPQVVGY